MVPLICPWSWSDDFGFPHMHNYRSLRRRRHPRWAYSDDISGPCCEFCGAYIEIVCLIPLATNSVAPQATNKIQPFLSDQIFTLQMFSPFLANAIFNAFERIHHHYKWGFDSDGPDAYLLAREMEKLAKILRGTWHNTGIEELGIWADQLQYMRREMQVGPARLRYNVMPRRRYNPRLLRNPW
ncbi:hypothetical protein BDW02DRAFT_208887 [Decorospora gaudefroyi]|uniref:Uncharacterized protein n=1 Tax=Decorospora gaudefroyi TaxID=184978 RepID=A0A6A5KLX3_9PLEO|nr:hypothetical protein BDW02DRAFT_208887 [Decorospora gaudefroyi]